MKLRWGVTGCGDIVHKAVAPAILEQQNSELAAFHSRSKSRAQEYARTHGAPRAYDNYEELLADEGIDAVYIATEVHRHAPLAIAAAQAGKHVLCEKPLALTVAEGQEVVRTCREQGVALAVAYYRRFHPKFIKMKELIEDGAIGQPIAARVMYTSLYDPPAEDPKRWRIVAAQSGGGPTMDVGSHRLDMLCFLFGQPLEAASFAATLTMNYDVEDSLTMIVRFEGGLQASCHFNWNIPVVRDNFEVLGSKGAMIASRFVGPGLLVAGSGMDIRHELPPPPNSHLGLLDDFATNVLAGRDPSYPGEEGLKASQIIEAAYESAKTRQTVRVESARN